MKCQGCGRSEASFHYSSNVNGCLTETHLCPECASGSGYDFGSMLGFGSIFDAFFPVLNYSGQYPAVFKPLSGFGVVFPTAVRTGPASLNQNGSCDCGCEAVAPETPPDVVDGEMKKRREINMLREQMKIAAGSDDFEKAIELRDKIREIE